MKKNNKTEEMSFNEKMEIVEKDCQEAIREFSNQMHAWLVRSEGGSYCGGTIV